MSDAVTGARPTMVKPVELDASIELPRGTFLKRHAAGRVTLIEARLRIPPPYGLLKKR